MVINKRLIIQSCWSLCLLGLVVLQWFVHIQGRCHDDAPIRIVVNNIIWLQMILHNASDYIVGKVAR